MLLASLAIRQLHPCWIASLLKRLVIIEKFWLVPIVQIKFATFLKRF